MDEIGINEILSGEDTHANNQKAFDLPSRLIAKIFLFRTIFRGSGWSFANDPDFMHVSSSSVFWDGMNEKFFEKYKAIDECHHRWANCVMAGDPIVGPLGRQWTINNRDKQGNIFVPWTTLSNFPVQGTGADIMMIVRIAAYKRAKKYNIPVIWRTTVHDSIVADVEEKYLQVMKELFDEVFRDIPMNIKKNFNYDWIVPMACETKFGKNMKDMVKMV